MEQARPEESSTQAEADSLGGLIRNADTRPGLTLASSSSSGIVWAEYTFHVATGPDSMTPKHTQSMRSRRTEAVQRLSCFCLAGSTLLQPFRQVPEKAVSQGSRL
jgi:hypothetical protein